MSLLSTPGCAGVWVDTIETFGTLKIADVLEPAIKLAEEGLVSLALHVSTLALLELVRVPVSEIHSDVVSASCVACHSQ